MLLYELQASSADDLAELFAGYAAQGINPGRHITALDGTDELTDAVTPKVAEALKLAIDRSVAAHQDDATRMILNDLTVLSGALPAFKSEVKNRLDAIKASLAGNFVPELERLELQVFDVGGFRDAELEAFEAEWRRFSLLPLVANYPHHLDVAPLKQAISDAANSDGDDIAKKASIQAAFRDGLAAIHRHIDNVGDAVLRTLNEDSAAWVNAHGKDIIAYNGRADRASTYQNNFEALVAPVRNAVDALRAARDMVRAITAVNDARLQAEVDLLALQGAGANALTALNAENGVQKKNFHDKKVAYDAINFIGEFKDRHQDNSRRVEGMISYFDANSGHQHAVTAWVAIRHHGEQTDDALNQYVHDAAVWKFRVLKEEHGRWVAEHGADIVAYNDGKQNDSQFEAKVRALEENFDRDESPENIRNYFEHFSQNFGALKGSAEATHKDLATLRISKENELNHFYAQVNGFNFVDNYARTAAHADNVRLVTDSIAAIKLAKASEMNEKVNEAKESINHFVEAAFNLRKSVIMGEGEWAVMAANPDVVRYNALAARGVLRVKALDVAHDEIAAKMNLQLDDLAASQVMFGTAGLGIQAYKNVARQWIADHITAYENVLDEAEGKSVKQSIGDVWRVTLNEKLGSFNNKNRTYNNAIADLALLGTDFAVEVREIDDAVGAIVQRATEIKNVVDRQEKDFELYTFIHGSEDGLEKSYEDVLKLFVSPDEGEGRFAKLKKQIKDAQYHVEAGGYMLRAGVATPGTVIEAELEAFTNEALAAFNLGVKDKHVYTSVRELYNNLRLDGDLKNRIDLGNQAQVNAKKQADAFVQAYAEVESNITSAHNSLHREFEEIYNSTSLPAGVKLALATAAGELVAVTDALNKAKDALKLVADEVTSKDMDHVEAALRDAQNAATCGGDNKTLDGLETVMDEERVKYDHALEAARKAVIRVVNEYQAQVNKNIKLSSNNNNQDVLVREGNLNEAENLSRLFGKDTRDKNTDPKNAVNNDVLELDKNDALPAGKQYPLWGVCVQRYSEIGVIQALEADVSMVNLHTYLLQDDSHANSLAGLIKAQTDAIKTFTNTLNEAKKILIERKKAHTELKELNVKVNDAASDLYTTDLDKIVPEDADRIDLAQDAYKNENWSLKHRELYHQYLDERRAVAKEVAVAETKRKFEGISLAQKRFDADTIAHFINNGTDEAHVIDQYHEAKLKELKDAFKAGGEIGKVYKEALTQAHKKVKLVVVLHLKAFDFINKIQTKFDILKRDRQYLLDANLNLRLNATKPVEEALHDMRQHINLDVHGEAHNFNSFKRNFMHKENEKTQHDKDCVRIEELIKYNGSNGRFENNILTRKDEALTKIQEHIKDVIKGAGNAKNALKTVFDDLADEKFLDLQDDVIFAVYQAQHLRGLRDKVKTALDPFIDANLVYNKVITAGAGDTRAIELLVPLSDLARINGEFNDQVKDFYQKVIEFEKETLLEYLRLAQPILEFQNEKAKGFLISLEDAYEGKLQDVNDVKILDQSIEQLQHSATRMKADIKDEILAYRLGFEREALKYAVKKEVEKIADATQAFKSWENAEAETTEGKIYAALSGEDVFTNLDKLIAAANGKEFGVDTIDNLDTLVKLKDKSIALKTIDTNAPIEAFQLAVRGKNFRIRLEQSTVSDQDNNAIDDMFKKLPIKKEDRDNFIRDLDVQAREVHQLSLKVFNADNAAELEAQLNTLEANDIYQRVKTAIVEHIHTLIVNNRKAVGDGKYSELNKWYKLLNAEKEVLARMRWRDLLDKTQNLVVYNVAWRLAEAYLEGDEIAKFDLTTVNEEAAKPESELSKLKDKIANNPIVTTVDNYEDDVVMETIHRLDDDARVALGRKAGDLLTQIEEFKRQIPLALTADQKKLQNLVDDINREWVTLTPPAVDEVGPENALLKKYQWLDSEVHKEANSKDRVILSADLEQERQVLESLLREEVEHLKAAIALHDEIKTKVQEIQALRLTAAFNPTTEHDFSATGGTSNSTLGDEKTRLEDIKADFLEKVNNEDGAYHDVAILDNVRRVRGGFEHEFKELKAAYNAYENIVTALNPVEIKFPSIIHVKLADMPTIFEPNKKYFMDLGGENIDSLEQKRALASLCYKFPDNKAELTVILPARLLVDITTFTFNQDKDNERVRMETLAQWIEEYRKDKLITFRIVNHLDKNTIIEAGKNSPNQKRNGARVKATVQSNGTNWLKLLKAALRAPDTAVLKDTGNIEWYDENGDLIERTPAQLTEALGEYINKPDVTVLLKAVEMPAGLADGNALVKKQKDLEQNKRNMLYRKMEGEIEQLKAAIKLHNEIEQDAKLIRLTLSDAGGDVGLTTEKARIARIQKDLLAAIADGKKYGDDTILNGDIDAIRDEFYNESNVFQVAYKAYEVSVGENNPQLIEITNLVGKSQAEITAIFEHDHKYRISFGNDNLSVQERGTLELLCYAFPKNGAELTIELPASLLVQTVSITYNANTKDESVRENTLAQGFENDCAGKNITFKVTGNLTGEAITKAAQNLPEKPKGNHAEATPTPQKNGDDFIAIIKKALSAPDTAALDVDGNMVWNSADDGAEVKKTPAEITVAIADYLNKV